MPVALSAETLYKCSRRKKMLTIEAVYRMVHYFQENPKAGYPVYSKACKENTGLTRAPERLSGEPPELGRPIVGKTAFKLDPARMQREHPIVLNEGKGCAIGGAGFGEGDSRLHVEAAAVSTGRRGIRYKSTRDSLGIFRRLNFLQRC